MKLLPKLALVPALAFALALDSDGGEFAWLVGCWVTPDKSAQEVWVADGDRSLAGFGVTISESAVAFYEVLSIKQSDDGTWTYTAHPSGQESASFVVVEMREKSVVFANPKHDYPQEIRYSRDGNQLYATVSLLGEINPKSFDKVACE
jgi:hypothetical protein